MRKLTYKTLLEYGFIRRYNSKNQLIFIKGDYTIILQKGKAINQLNKLTINNFDELKESYKKQTNKSLRRSYKESLQIDNKQ